MYICSATNDHHINTDFTQTRFQNGGLLRRQVLCSLVSNSLKTAIISSWNERCKSAIPHPSPHSPHPRQAAGESRVIVQATTSITYLCYIRRVWPQDGDLKKKDKMAGVRALPPPTPTPLTLTDGGESRVIVQVTTSITYLCYIRRVWPQDGDFL